VGLGNIEEGIALSYLRKARYNPELRFESAPRG
jgi:hypothetical protein